MIVSRLSEDHNAAEGGRIESSQHLSLQRDLNLVIGIKSDGDVIALGGPRDEQDALRRIVGVGRDHRGAGSQDEVDIGGRVIGQVAVVHSHRSRHRGGVGDAARRVGTDRRGHDIGNAAANTYLTLFMGEFHGSGVGRLGSGRGDSSTEVHGRVMAERKSRAISVWLYRIWKVAKSDSVLVYRFASSS